MVSLLLMLRGLGRARVSQVCSVPCIRWREVLGDKEATAYRDGQVAFGAPGSARSARTRF